MAKLATIFGVLFLICVLLDACAIEARPLNIMSLSRGHAVDDALSDGFFDGLLLGAMKQSGPSPGEGHKFTDSGNKVRVMDSGPSPGEGHKFADSGNKVRVKDSGPSPGDGHKFINSGKMVRVMDSGPSPGEGH